MGNDGAIVFDEVTREANELRIQLVDCANNLSGIATIAFVMEIGDVQKARLSGAGFELGDPQISRLNEARISAEHRRKRECGQA